MSGLKSATDEEIFEDFTSDAIVVTGLPPPPALTPAQIARVTEMRHRFLTTVYYGHGLSEPAEEDAIDCTSLSSFTSDDKFYARGSCVPTDSDDEVPDLMEAPPPSTEEIDRETRLNALLGDLDRDGDEEVMYPVHAGN